MAGMNRRDARGSGTRAGVTYGLVIVGLVLIGLVPAGLGRTLVPQRVLDSHRSSIHSREIAAPAPASRASTDAATRPTARRPLSFEDRVAAQRAIEDVYWRNRIWPAQNPGPKPPLEAVMPESAIRRKVEDSLKESNALSSYWGRPITAAQLQAETARMSRSSERPELLAQLFEALQNEPYLIAECLARPVLADRLVRNLYARDDRLHGAVREKAERELRGVGGVEDLKHGSGRYKEVAWVHRPLSGIGGSADIGAAAQTSSSSLDAVPLDDEEWNRGLRQLARIFDRAREGDLVGDGPIRRDFLSRGLAADPAQAGALTPEALPLLEVSRLQEDNESFSVTAVLSRGPDAVRTATATWPKTSFAEWWQTERRHQPGEIEAPLADYPRVTVRDGCVNDTWQPTEQRVPDPRYSHTAVWTGSEMIVWGGIDPPSALDTGGRYDPATDTWTPTSTGENVPSPRVNHTAVWTGTEMIVWGGATLGSDVNTGGRYNPQTDSWTATNAGPSAPDPRELHTAVWTGAEMLVWGGQKDGGAIGTGARYDPAKDTTASDPWTPMSTASGAPAPRSRHTAVWTGSAMIVWGGFNGTAPLNEGATFDPATDTWTATTLTGAPSGRSFHSCVWTGHEMIVWGGSGKSSRFDSGGRYDPLTNRWTKTSRGSGLPAARALHSAVWTGSEMIVWGGGANTGARYSPATDTWTPTGTGANLPTARGLHTAIWTGTEMIVWGGNSGGPLNTGARYDPQSDVWTPTSLDATVPAARSRHSAVWTGSEMIVWGGVAGAALATGGRYDPATDGWTPTSVSGSVPSARASHTAVWTGTEMIVWGGIDPATRTALGDGARYDPSGDAWTAVASGPGAPAARSRHTALWTGSEMIVWGGRGASGLLGNGARYDPSHDLWTPTSAQPDDTNAPQARADHTAVWTGSEMIVWGGLDTDGTLNTGARYDPESDAWSPVDASSTDVPQARSAHSAVWTGTEMIVWGGFSDTKVPAGLLSSGGRYNPATDSWRTTSDGDGLPSARAHHSAVWTGTEMVVWGGEPALNRPTASGARYHPGLDIWSQTSPGAHVPSARSDHTAVWTGDQMIVWGGSETASGGLYCAECTNPATWGQDPDGDGIGDSTPTRVACSQPLGYAPIGQDNCPTVFNPDQSDVDGDGTGDVCDLTLFDPPDLTVFQPDQDAPVFRWFGAGQNLFTLEFSADPSFSTGKIKRRSVGRGQTQFTPSVSLWNAIKALAPAGDPIYWRFTVKKKGSGKTASDQVFSFSISTSQSLDLGDDDHADLPLQGEAHVWMQRSCRRGGRIDRGSTVLSKDERRPRSSRRPAGRARSEA